MAHVPLRTLTVMGTSMACLVAAAAQESTEQLPEIVVTTPSPIVKAGPKKAPKAATAPKQKKAAQEGPATSPAPQQAEPDAAAAFQSVPGTVIVDADAFVAVTIATEREIIAQQGATITDTLQNKPGIAGTTFAPGANRPIIRGLDSYRVRTQENGIGTHDVAAISEDHAIPIDPYAADRIEVVRGPATLRYGSQAIGGVVSVENQRIPAFVPSGGFSGEIKGGLSSVDEGRDGAFKAAAGANGIVVHADAFKRSADDYDTPRGRVLNSFVDSEGFSVGASRVWSSGFLGVAFATVESVYGIPGEEAEEGVNPRIDLAQDKVLAKGEWRVRDSGIDAIRFWFGASDYAHDELAIHDPGEDEEFEVGSRFTNREQEARAEVQHLPVGTVLGELRGAVGVQWSNRKTRGQSFEGQSLLEPAHTQSIAGFWFEEMDFAERLRFQAASRIEHTKVDGIGLAEIPELEEEPDPSDFFKGERAFTPVSGSLGLLYELPLGVVARLTGQYVERAPDAAELFSKGIHEATGTFEIGNPFLEKEKATTIEAGLKRASGALRFDASAYYTCYDGFIYRQLTGEECGPTFATCGEEDEGDEEEHGHEHFDQVLFQQRDATFYGVELAAQYDIAPIWHGVWGIDVQYDFVRATFENGENVPRMPPHRLGGGLYYRDTNWFARTGVLHAFDQNAFGENEIATPGYTLVSAEISYTMTRDPSAGVGPEMTIGLKGENLADDEVLNHASFKRREDVLLPGASVRLFSSMKLN